MTDSYRRIARRHLDAQLAPWRAEAGTPPPDGWIRALRQALGMSTADLARAMGVTPAAVRKYEAAERNGTIQLSTLRRVAEALGADVRYAVVPKAPLEQLVQDRAELVAARELAVVNHTMDLEQQRPRDTEDAAIVRARASELVDSRGLWREP